MNRDDWLIVFLRAFGVYLAVNGILSFLQLLAMGLTEGGGLVFGILFVTVLRIAVGVVLFLLAPLVVPLADLIAKPPAAPGGGES